MEKQARRWRVLLPTGMVLVGIGAAAAYFSGNRSMPEPRAIPGGLRVGASVPDFTLPRLEQSPIKSSDLRAKVVLINFWASWCNACLVEMPSIVKLRQSYKDKGFEAVAVNVDEKPEEAVPPLIKRLGIDFPSFVDRDQKLSELFDIQALPFTVILDSGRKVLLIETGERDWNGTDMRSQLERWLAS